MAAAYRKRNDFIVVVVTDALTETTETSAPWHRICPMSELEPLWGEAALIQGQQVALIRLSDDRIFAVSQWDPIAKANVMARGIIGSRGQTPTLASPIHKQVYSLETGQCLSQEAEPLRTFPVRIDDGDIILQLDPAAQ